MHYVELPSTNIDARDPRGTRNRTRKKKRAPGMRERPYKRDLIGTRPWIIVYASQMSGLFVHSRASDDESSIDDRKSERHLARKSLDV